MEERDPITALREGAIGRGIATAEDFDAIDAEITAIVADALTFAMESPCPEPATATLHIYSEQ